MRPLFFCTMGFVLASFASASQAANSVQPSVLVQITKLEKGQLAKTVNAYGTVEADPSTAMTLAAPLAAVVGDVYVRPGQDVAKATPLIRLVPNPQTSSAYSQAVSALQNARGLLTHTQELFQEQLATRQDLANAQKAVSDAQAAEAALRRQGAGGANILRAPSHMIVTKLSVNAGATVDVGTPLVELTAPNSLVLQVGTVPDQALSIKIGDTARVTPVGTSAVYIGKVLLRGAMVDSSTGLVPVEISLPPGGLLPGQTAEATIISGLSQGYVVPHDAVLVDNNGQPYVVQAVRMTAKIVPVHIVNSEGGKDLIEGNLDPNAPLVLSGNYQLEDGMRIRLSKKPGK